MIFLFDMIVLLLGGAMFFVKGRPAKVSILITNSLLFSQVPIPGNDSNLIIIIFFFLSEIQNINKFVRRVEGTIAGYSFFVLCIFAIYSIVVSPHLNQNPGSMISFIKSNVVSNYLVIVITFCSICSLKDYEKIIRQCYIPVCILFVIAVLNYTTHQPYFLKLIGGGTENIYLYSERYRVQATFSLGCTYGYYNIFILLLYLFAVFKKMGSRKKNMLVLVMSLVGVYFSGFRTCILAVVAALLLYVLFAYKLKKGLKVMLMSAMVAVSCYTFIPYVENFTDYVLSVFGDSSEQKIGSSSLEMRVMQLAAVWRHTKDVPLTGNGVGFFLIDMGWGKGRHHLIDSELQGLESIFFSHLLERGIIGVLIYALFLLLVFLYFLRYREKDRIVAGFGGATLGAYFVFSMATGEQGSFLPTAILLGLFMRLLHESKAQYVR